jgi:uncharacterized membrane protein
MVLMALDHVRDFFHKGAFAYSPIDPIQSNLPVFFTRWITHYCAPIFCLLAGTSIFLMARRKSKNEVSKFLIKRGIWLMIMEVSLINFAWFFDIRFSVVILGVIWVLGLSMIGLAALIHLPKRAIIIFGLVIVFGHNALDFFSMDGNGVLAFVHRQTFHPMTNHFIMSFYPFIPWIGVMALGYYIGTWYAPDVDHAVRKKRLLRVGLTTTLLFFVIRALNGYGNPQAWSDQPLWSQDIISFMAPLKYPPSLSYLLMTLGPALLFLGFAEKWKGKFVDFLSVFGKVPFFYYLLHLYVIHALALVLAQLTGYGWQAMILKQWVNANQALAGYGLNLALTYGVWILVILLLYPLCKRYGDYKLNNKDKWWLSYL